MHTTLTLISGGIVGFTLCLIGGGGSVLAVPLIYYVIGAKNPHIAIGTSAVAVAINALVGLGMHAREKRVKWRCAAIFAPPGVLGAVLGAYLGRAINGAHLLLLFAILMIVVALLTLKGRKNAGIEGAACGRDNARKVALYGTLTGTFSGFFGIGGGFLIVPALIASTSMPIFDAVGTSLVAVSAFGLSAAASYAMAGLVDWSLALWFVVGGAFGSIGGTAMARYAGKGTGTGLKVVFATLILMTAIYMICKSV